MAHLIAIKIREWHQQIGRCNYEKWHQKLTKMRVAPSTSTVQIQTSNDTGVMQTQTSYDSGVRQTQTPDNWQGKVKNMPASASQTDDWEQIKKKVLLELGMNEELAEACIEFPEELCLKLQDFTEAHMPSSSYELIGVAQMESDSDNHSEVSTASTGR